jgi:predicted short-subunit dehydrogenase-like oxidoreductase (DUF2520 family)
MNTSSISKLSVSPSYLIVGSGRLAHHLRFYLGALDLKFDVWSRRESSLPLVQASRGHSHILVTVKDSAIEEVSAEIPDSLVRVHFSGALKIPGLIGAHPLMTFGPETEALDWYKKIPFILDPGTKLSDALPALPNPWFHLEPTLRPLYHALCSLAGNSTYLLWQQIALEWQNSLGLPTDVLRPFLQQVLTNALDLDTAAFTGPVARGDWPVVQNHLKALRSHPELEQAYQAYLRLADCTHHPVPKELL